MDLGLDGRTYLVTGGSRGLGRATAERLVADGARVLVTGRDRDVLDAAVAGMGPRASGVVADNADPDTPARLVQIAHQQWGRLDGALLSVGGPPAASVLGTPDADWTAAFETVFLGAVRLAREVGRSLADSGGDGGSLLLVLSSSVRQPVPGLAISNGLRPGLAMVAKTLADELGPAGVRVNGVLPGRIDTDRVRELDAGQADPTAARRAHEAAIALRRYGEAAEFGRVAAFLLSPAASYVTGTMVPVDGGMLRSP